MALLTKDVKKYGTGALVVLGTLVVVSTAAKHFSLAASVKNAALNGL